MMKTLVSVVLLGALCSAPSVMAHEGHNHNFVTEPAAMAIGKDYSVQLTEKDSEFGVGKLPGSWKNVSANSVKLHTNGAGYYIVAVTNDAEQKTLYVLMTTNGDVYNANFTGEFKELKQ